MEKISIRAGNAEHANGTTFQVAAIWPHEEFNWYYRNFDFALLKLAEPIELGETMQAVELPEQDSTVDDGEVLTVTGWGQSRDSDEAGDKLQSVQVPKVEQAACVAAYQEITIVSEEMICTGSAEGDKGPCVGDDGGPLVNSDKVLVGLFSWGNGCATADFPDVYSRVASVVDWIKGIISKD